MYGYLFHYLLKNRVNYSLTCIHKVENTILLKFFTKLKGFITIADANNVTGLSISNQINNNNKTNNIQSESQI